MDEKRFEFFSRLHMILFEGVCEKYNAPVKTVRTVLVDGQEEGEAEEGKAS